jgi:hypothetical protein
MLGKGEAAVQTNISRKLQRGTGQRHHASSSSPLRSNDTSRSAGAHTFMSYAAAASVAAAALAAPRASW